MQMHLDNVKFQKQSSDVYQTFYAAHYFFFLGVTMSLKPSLMLRICTLTFFFLFITFSADVVSSAAMVAEASSYSSKVVASAITEAEESRESEAEVSYSDYCSSVLPVSITNSQIYFVSSFGPFEGFNTGYYIGGNRILNPKITRISNLLSFETRYVSKTDADGVYKIKGSLTIYRPVYPRTPFYLKLHGFWSESSGKLCMVGMGSAYSKEGNLLTPSAVFKLSNLKNSSSITTLITGTVESLWSGDGVSYFEPISIIMFPRVNYKYTFASRESVDEYSAESDSEQNLPLSVLPRTRFCSITSSSVNVFKLQYSSDCIRGKKNCLPFGGLTGHLPRFLSFTSIGCSDVEKRIQVLVEFRNNSHVGNHQSFNPNTTLIGEGTWDDKKNRMFVFVCQFLDIRESWSNARVGDCTTRLRLSFPAILSMRETSSVKGQIWTKKTVNESGYFNRIVFRSTWNHMEAVPGLKYEYTELDRVKNSCPRNELVRNKGERYPTVLSTDMKLDMLIKSSEAIYGWGSAVPLAIGDQLYKQYLYPMALPNSTVERAVSASWLQSRPITVSYEVSITLQTPTNLFGGVYFSYLIEEKMEVTAEGVYDSQNGKLCMVGCRKLGSNNQMFQNASLDCEVHLNFQLSPLESAKSGGYFKGCIKSTRKKADPLYFDRLDVSSTANKADQGTSLVRTMDDPEIPMVLISNILVCIFVGLQLYHVKKNPEVLSFISLVMLVILTLGHMIPLALDFEALCPNRQYQDKVLSHSSERFELNEAIVTLVMVVAFLLLLRLLQLTVSARSHDVNQKCLWFAEEMTALAIAFLYAVGAKITLLVAWEKYRREVVFLFSSSVKYQHNLICTDLKPYADLILDMFLLPQILLNMFSNSKQNALSYPFYIGTTFVRLLPHAHDLYHNDSYVLDNMLLFSVSPDKAFLSAAWDVIVMLGLLVLAAIIYFQQQFGGHCVLPSRFQELAYPEKFPLVTESLRPQKPSA